MKPVNTIQMNPSPGATVRMPPRVLTVSSWPAPVPIWTSVPECIFNARGAKTEIITRAITTGGNIVSRGYIEGNEPEVKGHLECRGLILGAKGTIHAIPELKGNLAGIDLYHEAAVGKIAEKK